jgi:hypothetical protein
MSSASLKKNGFVREGEEEEDEEEEGEQTKVV